MMEREGVVQFRLEHKKGSPPTSSEISDLERWRRTFYLLKIIGQDSARYHGLGFGNLSRRAKKHAQSFWVTGTQTGRLSHLTPRHYSKVTHFDPQNNWVKSVGPTRPSSESMTHGSIYQMDTTCQVVIHVHSPLIWRQSQRLNLPTTKPSVKYGTPGMARDVNRLFQTKNLHRCGIFSMLGHQDGIIGFGRTADEAGERILSAWVKAAGM